MLKIDFNLTLMQLTGIVCLVLAGALAGAALTVLGYSPGEVQLLGLATGVGLYALLDREFWFGFLALSIANTVLHNGPLAVALAVVFWGWFALFVIRAIASGVRHLRERRAARKAA